MCPGQSLLYTYWLECPCFLNHLLLILSTVSNCAAVSSVVILRPLLKPHLQMVTVPLYLQVSVCLTQFRSMIDEAVKWLLSSKLCMNPTWFIIMAALPDEFTSPGHISAVIYSYYKEDETECIVMQYPSDFSAAALSSSWWVCPASLWGGRVWLSLQKPNQVFPLKHKHSTIHLSTHPGMFVIAIFCSQHSHFPPLSLSKPSPIIFLYSCFTCFPYITYNPGFDKQRTAPSMEGPAHKHNDHVVPVCPGLAQYFTQLKCSLCWSWSRIERELTASYGFMLRRIASACQQKCS